jgi:predicted lactoylglutathione lyase
MAASRKLFVNLPVQDLKRSVDFFTKLGFVFNAQFTDETATCMVLSDDAYVMLLVRSRFEGFARRPVSDATKQTEALFAFQVASRAEVDDVVSRALAAGGAKVSDPQDHGFMYLQSFYDLDGHHWEVFWMDEKQMPQSQ